MLGPLVIAGVVVAERGSLRRLSSLGVRDSKKLSPKRRNSLFKSITSLVDDYYIAKIFPRSIDASVRRHCLNDLEARYMARVVSKLDPDTSYVDSCDVNAARFGRKVSEMSGNRRIMSYHHADSRFVVVSAASILAKVARDRAIRRLQGDGQDDLGSGYPSDSVTVGFVRSYYLRNGSLPTFVRKSWRPVRRLVAAGTSRRPA